MITRGVALVTGGEPRCLQLGMSCNRSTAGNGQNESSTPLKRVHCAIRTSSTRSRSQLGRRSTHTRSATPCSGCNSRATSNTVSTARPPTTCSPLTAWKLCASWQTSTGYTAAVVAAAGWVTPHDLGMPRGPADQTARVRGRRSESRSSSKNNHNQHGHRRRHRGQYIEWVSAGRCSRQNHAATVQPVRAVTSGGG
jgi:hypothetical protein